MADLRITFYFRSPVSVGDQPLHLDSLLAWVQVQRALNEGADDPYNAQNNLPLEKIGNTWKASRLYFEPGRSIREPILKAWGFEAFARSKKVVWDGARDKFSVGTGKMKAFKFYRDAKWSRSAVAWCRGDKDEIKDLLEDVRFLGRYGRNGMGEIEDISIDEASTLEKDNWRLRSLPSSLSKEKHPEHEYAKAIGNITAPYWDRSKQEEIFIPISQQVLFVQAK